MDLDWYLSKTWKRKNAKAPRMRDCCKTKNNLKYAVGKNNRKDMVVLQCTVCKAYHYRPVLQSGSYNTGR